MTRRGARRPDDRGSVVAEFAVAMPGVLLVLALLLGGVQVAGAQVHAQDAAADVARSWARGESAVAASALRGLPGAAVSRSSSGPLVCATVTARPAGPIARLGLRARATSCALAGGR